MLVQNLSTYSHLDVFHVLEVPSSSLDGCGEWIVFWMLDFTDVLDISSTRVSTGNLITYHEDEVRSFWYTILQTNFVEIPQQCIPPFLILLLLLFKEAPLFGLL